MGRRDAWIRAWGKVETGVRLEKKSPNEFVVVINAAGDMPENEYLFTKIVKVGKQKEKKREKAQQ